MWSSLDYKDFAKDTFDATEYGNVILKAPSDSTFHGMDVSTALAKLSFGIDHLNKQIQEQVTTHYEDLLHQVTGMSHLEESLTKVKESTVSLNASFDRVRAKIVEPYEQIQGRTRQLEHIQAAAEVLRRVIRFLYLVRRLETQLPGGERELAKAALSLSEMDNIIEESDLNGIAVVDAELDGIAKAKEQIQSQADALLERGMASQNQTDVAAGLQVFHNLGQMAAKAQDIIEKMLERIGMEMRHAFDVASLNKEVKDATASTSQGPVRRVNEPAATSANAVAWNNALWARMEKLMDAMYDNAVKVYLLERVLSRKRDATTHVSFLDEVAKNMDGNIVTFFWRILSHTFERELRLATKAHASQFLHQLFQIGYPKLLRLFHDFFSRIAVVSGSVFNEETKSPESVHFLKSLAAFETAYLSRSLSRLLDPVNFAFPDKPLPGARTTPSRDDVDKIVRTITTELDVVKFDASLLRSVSKNVGKALNMYAVKCESLSATDSNAYHISGAGTATHSQMLNLDIINCLWWLQESVWKVVEEYGESSAVDGIADALETLSKLLQGIVEPLLSEITREFERTILKIHKEELLSAPAVPPRGSPSRAAASSPTSQYVVELAGKIRWTQNELLARMQCGDESKEWIRSVAARVIDFFLRHASLVRPLTEQLKIRLASDMTQLEFTLNQWFTVAKMRLESDLRDSYRALRAFRYMLQIVPVGAKALLQLVNFMDLIFVCCRPLLFLDLSQVTATHHTSTLSPLIVLHHLFCRAHGVIHLPTTVFGWTEVQYSEWLDAHEEVQAIELLERCLDVYVEEVRRRGEKEFCAEYPVIRAWITRGTSREPIQS
ncbi:Conserved oligomeric Golgi complex subunit [Borealophlyctis nickersoniae]|nr:Conserved oligomeric Golgi complex subunit [Borealophlyctis nickersoniae]